VRREDFSGARTALSVCFRRIGAFARTKLSALLWLRLRRAVPLRGKIGQSILFPLEDQFVVFRRHVDFVSRIEFPMFTTTHRHDHAPEQIDPAPRRPRP
jgi:hypothetical protein